MVSFVRCDFRWMRKMVKKREEEEIRIPQMVRSRTKREERGRASRNTEGWIREGKNKRHSLWR